MEIRPQAESLAHQIQARSPAGFFSRKLVLLCGGRRFHAGEFRAQQHIFEET